MFLVKARSEPSHMQHSGFFTFFVSWAVPAFLLLLAYIKWPDGRHVLHFLAKSTDDWKCVTVLLISNSAVLLSDGTNVLPVHYRSWSYTLNHHKNVKKRALKSFYHKKLSNFSTFGWQVCLHRCTLPLELRYWFDLWLWSQLSKSNSSDKSKKLTVLTLVSVFQEWAFCSLNNW